MIERLKYFAKNWKIGVHLLFRTKHFGVNNEWWVKWDSLFGWSNKKKIWGIIRITPIIDNWEAMKYRSGVCHFLSNETYRIVYNEGKPCMKIGK